MKKLILAFVCAAFVMPALASASEGGVALQKANIDPANTDSLRRGAKLYVDYCMGCHSLQYMSYGRMAKDLGLSKQQVFDTLMFAWDKKRNLGNHMKISMRPGDAADWFGKVPPDLTLVARSRGVDWLYTYLHSFYVDKTRPFGVNNLVFPKVGMPDVLWQLEGFKQAKFKEVEHKDGTKEHMFEGYSKAVGGIDSPEKFDGKIRDLANFLAYAAEPGKPLLHRVGIWVIAFLLVLLVITYALKKEYWKDVH